MTVFGVSNGSVGAAASVRWKCSAIPEIFVFFFQVFFCLRLKPSAHRCSVSVLHFAKINCQSKCVGAAAVFVLGFSVDGL